MIRGCILVGAALTSQCQAHPRLYATDRLRCWSDPHRVKLTPVRREATR